jgi:hypothetical protein
MFHLTSILKKLSPQRTEQLQPVEEYVIKTTQSFEFAFRQEKELNAFMPKLCFGRNLLFCEVFSCDSAHTFV